ncbi:MAG: alpha/beta fold hydrolase, partial [Thermodesulfobacteriota bacterium]
MVKRSRESVVELDSGIEIAYETFGKGNNPPLILVMGLACQMVVWDDELCEQLADQGFWVIRFDNRDCGRSTHFYNYGMPDFPTLFTVQSSERPKYVAYTLQDMAEDVLGLMDYLQIESAHVAGISMGGMIAQVLATNHPHRVKTLTSIASSTGNPNLPPPTRE